MCIIGVYVFATRPLDKQHTFTVFGYVDYVRELDRFFSAFYINFLLRFLLDYDRIPKTVYLAYLFTPRQILRANMVFSANYFGLVGKFLALFSLFGNFLACIGNQHLNPFEFWLS